MSKRILRLVGAANSVRKFSGTILPEVQKSLRHCPWYKIPSSHLDREEFSNLNRLRSSLGSMLNPLIYGDGFHKGLENIGDDLSGRAKIIANYHRAIFQAEERFVLKSVPLGKMVLNDKVMITCIKTEDEKAKGCYIIASIASEVVGRMFVADALDDKHLTIFSTDNYSTLQKNSVDSLDVLTQMLRSYFCDRQLSEEEFKILLQSRVRKSCIGDYEFAILKIAEKQKLLPPSNDAIHLLSDMIEYCPRDDDDIIDDAHIGNPLAARLKMSFSMKSLGLIVGVTSKYQAIPQSIVKDSSIGTSLKALVGVTDLRQI